MPAVAPHRTVMRDLLGLTYDALTAAAAEAGFGSGAVRNIWNLVHRRHIPGFDHPDAAGLPARQRAWLAGAFTLPRPSVSRALDSANGDTRKFLLRLADGEEIETVAMRYLSRTTACLSTQAGCAMGCVFCATGQAGFRRHLTAGEIIAQARHAHEAAQLLGAPLRNIVLMGMGEPLHNFDAVADALRILLDDRGWKLAASRVTLSTVGIVPGILRLAREGPLVNLAVSLHGATDADRNALVPVGRRWPMAELLDACRTYAAASRRPIFFEWTLIAGRNDSAAHAHTLGSLLQGMPAHVNVIPLNPTTGYDGLPSHLAAVTAFQAILRTYGLPSTVRQRRGIDIAAGCGQLRRPEVKALA